MFGTHVDEPVEEKKEGIPSSNANGASPSSPAAVSSSSSGSRDPPEMAMGNFLSFAQDLSNYITRCYNVVKNTIHQLACLYHERYSLPHTHHTFAIKFMLGGCSVIMIWMHLCISQKLYISTFKDVDLVFVFEAIGELSRALITIDAIIEDNKEIAAGWR
jgi:hypothetical protein